MKNYYYKLFSNRQKDIFIRDLSLTVPKDDCLEVTYNQVKKSFDIRKLLTSEAILLQKIQCGGQINLCESCFKVPNKACLDDLIRGMDIVENSSFYKINAFRNIPTPFDGMIVLVDNPKTISDKIDSKSLFGYFKAKKIETEHGWVQDPTGEGSFIFDYNDKIYKISGKKAKYMDVCKVTSFALDKENDEILNNKPPINHHDHHHDHHHDCHDHFNHEHHDCHDHFYIIHNDCFDHEHHIHCNEFNDCHFDKHHCIPEFKHPVNFPSSVGDLYIKFISMLTTPVHGIQQMKFKFECCNCDIVKIRKNKNAILNSIYDCDIKLEVVGNEIFVTLDFYGSLENGHEYNLLMPQSMFVILTDDGINIGSPEITLSRIIC